MRSIIITGALMLIAISGTAYGAVDSWCRYLPTNGGFCYTWNETASAYQSTGIKLDWSMILNPPGAYGGGTTIPVANVTNLAQSKTCSGTDKVKNITINNTGIYLNCDTDVSGGTGGVTLPFQNITGFNISSFPMANTTYSGTSLPWTNITGYPGATAIPYANVTGVGLSAIPWANITYPGITGLTVGTNVTGFGITVPQANITTGINAIPLGNLTGSSSDKCTGTEKVTNVSVTNGVLDVVCDTDALGEAGSGSLFSTPWLYNISTTGYFNDTYANATYDTRYKKLTEMNGIPMANTTWTGLTGIAWANITYPGITGLTIGTNVTGFGVTIPFSNVTAFSVTGFPMANTSWTGLTGIPMANTTYSGTTLPYANVTGVGLTAIPMTNISYPGAKNIPQANLTGLTIPFSNVTNFNVSGIGWTNITGYPGANNIAQANLTGITIPAGNVSNATVFGNYNYTFQGNISLLTTNKICLNSGCTQWIVGNSTGIWIQG